MRGDAAFGWGRNDFQLERSNRSDSAEPRQEFFRTLTDAAWLAFGFAVNLQHLVVVRLCPSGQPGQAPL
jgi:hypothetical protein